MVCLDVLVEERTMETAEDSKSDDAGKRGPPTLQLPLKGQSCSIPKIGSSDSTEATRFSPLPLRLVDLDDEPQERSPGGRGGRTTFDESCFQDNDGEPRTPLSPVSPVSARRTNRKRLTSNSVASVASAVSQQSGAPQSPRAGAMDMPCGRRDLKEVQKLLQQDLLPKLQGLFSEVSSPTGKKSNGESKSLPMNVAMCIKTAFPLLQHLNMALEDELRHSGNSMGGVLKRTCSHDSLASSDQAHRNSFLGSFMPEYDRQESDDALQRAHSNHTLIYDSVCSAPAFEITEELKPMAKRVSLSMVNQYAMECVCGNFFIEDAKYCRKCGMARPLRDGCSVGGRQPSKRSFSTFSSGNEDKQRRLNRHGDIVTSSNKCYIHPERPFRLGWELVSLLLILVVSVTVPIELAFYFEQQTPSGLEGFSQAVDVYFGVDILLNFFTAYHTGHGLSGMLVNRLSSIAFNYLRGWFFIDLLATFPYGLVVGSVGDDDPSASNTTDAAGMLRMLKYAKIARVMKVLRVLKLGGLMQMVEEKMVAAQSMTVVWQLAKMTVVMLIVSHNVACLYFFLGDQGADETWMTTRGLPRSGEPHVYKSYVAAFYFAITTGTTVGYGDIHPHSALEQCVTAVLLVVSVGYIGQFLGRVSQIVNSLRQNDNEMAQTKREALLFMTRRDVTKLLQFKVLRYIEHTFETSAVTHLDEKIMSTLSESLQSQLALQITGNIFRQFPLFEDVGSEFLTALCSCGRTKRAGIGDLIVLEESAAHEMFWVVRGEVAVSRRNMHLATLKRSDWFGELALFFPGAVRTCTVRCETNCEFLVLHYEDFRQQLREFPKIRKEYDKLAQELRRGDPRGLKLVCHHCGSKEHLTRDCPLIPRRAHVLAEHDFEDLDMQRFG
eukprot:TRINITY_DN13848_c0_g1_i1.p1 TRINITY_DN13848_c0_g1~~TRINITY_DN13848_c0_g1_i1.p1  ORF type:complete len:889 (+),score=245.78 TRINITY_DN13848_c0_g1_i1:167-2833(+)